jgi:hypothetical protein
VERREAADGVRRVALLAPMRHELRPLLHPLGLRRDPEGPLFRGAAGRTQVVAAITGIGMRAAARATERMLDEGAFDRVLVVGIAGGIAQGARIGDLVVPEQVLDLASGTRHRPAALAGLAPRGVLATEDGMLSDRDALRALRGRGVVAIDMETAAVAAVCERRGVAWSVLRAISDHVDHAPVDPAVFALAGPDGGPDLAALARFLLVRPWRLATLARLARDMRTAANAAAAAAVRALAQA